MWKFDRTVSSRFPTALPRDRELIILPDGGRSPPAYPPNLIYDRPDERTERIGMRWSEAECFI